MTGKKRSRNSDEHLDRTGRELVRASTSPETEAEAFASSPFLYTRIRARIAAERERRAEKESWLALLGVVWRAVPAMALVAIFALVMFVSASFNRQPSVASNDYTILGTSNTGVENVVFADSRNMSSDDVLATIMSEDEQEASR
jgi:anti-sigma-K factor RskA